MAALRKLGVRCAVGFSAVGSLKEEVRPRDFVVVDQYVDWTKGVSLSMRFFWYPYVDGGYWFLEEGKKHEEMMKWS